MGFAWCWGTELLSSSHSSTSTMVQMAEGLGAFLTMGTSGCPLVKGVVTLVWGIWEAELSPISQLTPLQSFCRTSRMRLMGGLCCVAHPALAIPRHGGAVAIFGKAQKTGTGTSYLAIHPIPGSCCYLGVHPEQSPAVTILLYLH